jgi:predicted alpha/beta-hydrolase family hydrolase
MTSSAPGPTPSVRGLLLFPGAGASRDAPALVALDRALSDEMEVVRADFPYRREGRKAPDRPPKAIACVRDEAALLADRAGIDPAAVALGGRSFGGRMCSMAVAEGLPAAALVLIAYPLHPMGKPDRLRVEHFPDIDVPCLFVSGTRDPFGTPDEFAAHTAAISGPVTHVWVDGGRHDLRGSDADVAGSVRDWLRGL